MGAHAGADAHADAEGAAVPACDRGADGQRGQRGERGRQQRALEGGMGQGQALPAPGWQLRCAVPGGSADHAGRAAPGHPGPDRRRGAIPLIMK